MIIPRCTSCRHFTSFPLCMQGCGALDTYLELFDKMMGLDNEIDITADSSKKVMYCSICGRPIEDNLNELIGKRHHGEDVVCEDCRESNKQLQSEFTKLIN